MAMYPQIHTCKDEEGVHHAGEQVHDIVVPKIDCGEGNAETFGD